MESKLPVELYHEVIAYLPRRQKRVCLFVSRSFHGIALQHLFSTIKLHFGAIHAPSEVSTPAEGDAREADTYAIARSRDLLDCVVSDPQFAAAVKRVVVYAFSKGPVIFERHSLERALRVLPRLLSFRWYGSHPDVARHVIDALATFCPLLQEIRLPWSISLESRQTLGLHRFKLLQAFLCNDRPYVPQVYEESRPWDGRQTFAENWIGDISDVVMSNYTTLTILESYVIDTLALPVRTFTQLTDLHLWDVQDANGLALIFHHAPRLRSLALRIELSDGIFRVLEQNASALRNLSSFKLLSPFLHPKGRFIRLSEFLKNLPCLRRLDLDISFILDIDTYFAMLTSLGRLEVLGLNLKGFGPIWEVLRILSECLPDELSALRINALFYHSRMQIGPLLDRLQQLPHFKFLHLEDGMRIFAKEAGRQPFFPGGLASALPKLTNLGLDDRIWDIDRSGAAVELKQWSSTKVATRVPEDFESLDEYWLMNNIRVLKSFD